MTRVSRVLFPDADCDHIVQDSNKKKILNIRRVSTSSPTSASASIPTLTPTPTSTSAENRSHRFSIGDSLARLGRPNIVPPSKENQERASSNRKRRRSRRQRNKQQIQMQQEQQEQKQINIENHVNQCNSCRDVGSLIGSICECISNNNVTKRKSSDSRRVTLEVMDILGNLGSLAGSLPLKKPKKKKPLKNITNCSEKSIGSHSQRKKKERKQRQTTKSIQRKRIKNRKSIARKEDIQDDDEENDNQQTHTQEIDEVKEKESIVSCYDKDECLLSPSTAPKAKKRIDTKKTPLQQQKQLPEDQNNYEERLDCLVWIGLSSTIRKKQQRKLKDQRPSSIQNVIGSTSADDSSLTDIRVSIEQKISDITICENIRKKIDYHHSLEANGFTPMNCTAADDNDILPTKQELASENKDCKSDHDDTKNGQQNGSVELTMAQSPLATNMKDVTPSHSLELIQAQTNDNCLSEQKTEMDGDRDSEDVVSDIREPVNQDSKVQNTPPLGMIDIGEMEKVKALSPMDELTMTGKEVTPSNHNEFSQERQIVTSLRRSSRRRRPVDRLLNSFNRERRESSNVECEVNKETGIESTTSKTKASREVPLKNRRDNGGSDKKPTSVRRSTRKKKPVERLTVNHKTRKNIVNSPEAKKSKSRNRNRKSKSYGIILDNGGKDADKSCHNGKVENDKAETGIEVIEAKRTVPCEKEINYPLKTKDSEIKEEGLTIEHVNQSEWDDNSLKMLLKAHKDVDPQCFSFWHQVAMKVPHKSAEQCRDKWFALVKTPKLRRKKPKYIASSLIQSDDDEDDIFNSTPIRNAAELILSWRKTTTSKKNKQKREMGHNKTFSDIFSSPIMKKTYSHYHNTEEAKSLSSPLQFRPMYKGYLKRVRIGLNDKRGCKSKHQINKIELEKRPKYLSAAVDAGDLHMDGVLTPNGTLRVDTPEECEVEDMYLSADEDAICDD